MEQSSNRRLIAVEGMPGIGKTELVLQAIYEVSKRSSFAGGVFWIDQLEEDLSAAWRRFAPRLGLDGTPVNAQAEAVVQRIETSGQRALIVIDGAATWKPEPQPLPRGPQITVLVTTQRRRFGGNSFEHIELRPLSAPDDRTLLEETAGRTLEDADDLLRFLDGNPLCIELAGAYLNENASINAPEYLELARQDPDGIQSEYLEGLPRYNRTMVQALAAVWRELSPAARKAWCLFGVMPDAPASTSLVTECRVDEHEIRDLRRYHILLNRRNNDNRISIHRQARHYVQLVSPTDMLQECNRDFASGCASYLRQKDDAELTERFLDNGPHLRAALHNVPSDLRVDVTAHVELIRTIARGEYLTGNLAGAEPLLLECIRMLDTAGIADVTHRSAVLADLAEVYRDTGRLPAAKELLERAVAIDETTNGPESPEAAIHLSRLAGVALREGSVAEAGSLLDRVLATWEKLGRSGTADALRDKMRKGLVLRNQKRLADALRILMAVRDAYESKRRHPELPKVLHNLALVEQDLGELDKARAAMQQALAANRDRYGNEHPSVATDLSALAGIERAAGNLEAALQHIEEAVRIDRIYGPRTHLLRDLQNLGAILESLGEKQKALDAFDEALRGLRDLFPDTDPWVMLVKDNIDALRATMTSPPELPN